ncbi:MAG: cyclic nucleotide-binding domain-containing protein [Proteobacteria bacterium]|nr:cyclic nucleotide-binding domain-containing protein [Pseudomonadota bacterium]
MGVQQNRTVEVLLAAGLLNAIPAEHHAALVHALNPRTFSLAANQPLVTKGQPATSLFVLLHGRALVYRGHVGEQQLIQVREAPCVIGEVAFFRPSRERTADVVAAGPLKGIEVNFQAIERLGNTSWALSFVRNLAGVVADRLDEATRKRADLQATSAEDYDRLRRFAPDTALDKSLDDSWGITERFSRKHAVVMFSDVVGFSALADDLGRDGDVGAIAQVLAPILGIQVDAIHQSRGEVDKFIGDAVMGFWVIDQPNDTCSIASSAVSAMASAITQIEKLPMQSSPRPLGIRVGMHIGEVSLGNFGTADRYAYTLIGSTVNYAARLEQVRCDADGCSLGPLRVSHELYAVLDSREQRLIPHHAAGTVKETALKLMHNKGQ